MRDESRAVRDAFLKAYAADRERGRLRQVEQYQALFPGHEADIAEEFALERHRGAKELFLAASERHTEERAAFLAAQCGDDDALRSEIESMLAVEARNPDFLEPPAAGTAAHPERIGPYRILEVLGEGGMGTVFQAEQKEPVRRRVALKLIKLGMDSRQVLARFEAERQALAMMNHDAIARVFEAGTTERGQPFFVMEHVEGLPITQYCDRHKLKIRQRIELFQQVCAGVQHAHQKGVIHRDLKPSNVLVTRRDERAIPKIIDFGLARATDHQLIGQTLFTEQGQILGTPEYMSPEQAGFDAQGIDTRTDIYSLGVMLYELLAGELPFSPKELRAAGMLEIQRKIREDQPPKPSTRVSTCGDAAGALLERRQTSLHALTRELRGDLDWIVLKAMAKEPERRYESATGMAMDLGRYLQHEPVLAGPPSAAYRVRKFVRKHRVQVTAVALVLVTLVAGVIGTTWFAFSAQEQTEIARTKEKEASSAAELAERKRLEADAAKSQASKAAATAEREKQDALRAQSLYLADLADEQTDAGDAMTGVLLALEALPREIDAPHRPYVLEAERSLCRSLVSVRETAIVRQGSPIGGGAFLPDGSGILSSDNRNQGQSWALREKRTTWLWDLHGNPVGSMRGGFFGFSPDGRIVTLTDGESSASLWDTQGQETAVLRSVAGITNLEISADGSRILTTSRNSTARLWDAGGKELLVLGFDGQVRKNPANPGPQLSIEQASLSSNGGRIATTLDDGTVRLWDADGQPAGVLGGESSGFTYAAFSPDGQRIVTVSKDRVATLWDAGRERIAIVRDFAGGRWSPDGRRFLTLSVEGSCHLWDRDGDEIAVLRHAGSIQNATFSADSRRIATTSPDGSVQLWSANGRQIAVLIGHEAPVRNVVFGPDSRRLLTASDDGTARLWDAGGKPLARLGKYSGSINAGFSPDGRSVATVGETEARLWDVDLREVTVLDAPGLVTHAAFGRDGKVHTFARRWNTRWGLFDSLERAVEQSGERTPHELRGVLTPWYRLATWDATEREVTRVRSRARAIPYQPYGPGGHRTSWHIGLRRNSVTVSADGSRILTDSDGIRLWDAAGRKIAALDGAHAAFSADGRRVVSTPPDKTARILDIDGNETAVLRGHEENLSYAAFSPDGRRVVTASADKTVRVWDTAGEPIAVLRGHEKNVTYATFSPRGDRILTAAHDGAARLWHTDGRPIAVLPQAVVLVAAFSPDQEHVVTAGWSYHAIVWDREGKQIAVLPHAQPVWFASFSADGRHILTASDDGKARLWYVDGREIVAFGDDVRSNAQASFSPDGSRILVVSDGTARLYPFYPTQALIDRGHEIAHRWLTPAERERFHLSADPLAPILDGLFDELILTDDVLDALDERGDLTAGQLQEARRRARQRVQPSSAALNERAWPEVDPDRTTPGNHALAVKQAGAAVRLAPETAAYRDTLAWALFADGRPDEALVASARALELAPEPQKNDYLAYQTRLRQAIVDQRLDALLQRQLAAADLLATLTRRGDAADGEPEWARRLAALRLGARARQLFDANEAAARDRSLEFARIAVELAPDCANLRHVLAQALTAHGLDAEARTASARAHELAQTTSAKVFGFTSGPPSAARARELGLAAEQCLLVTKVEVGSMAEFAGVQVQDVITSVAGRSATTAVLRLAKDERDWFETIPFEIRRGDRTLQLDVPIGASVEIK